MDTGTLAYIGGIKINASSLYLGDIPALINPTYARPGIPLDGLMAYYDATKTESYPGSGTTWFDISGNNINLVAK